MGLKSRKATKFLVFVIFSHLLLVAVMNNSGQLLLRRGGDRFSMNKGLVTQV